MSVRAGWAGLIAFLLLAIGGCTTGSKSSSIWPVPSGFGATPVPAGCAIVPKGTPALAFPANGATNVSPSIGTLLIAQFDPWPANLISLSSALGVVPITPTAVPSPLPAGLPNSPYEAFTLPPLVARVRYTVTFTQPSGLASPCPAATAIPLGTFDTGS